MVSDCGDRCLFSFYMLAHRCTLRQNIGATTVCTPPWIVLTEGYTGTPIGAQNRTQKMDKNVMILSRQGGGGHSVRLYCKWMNIILFLSLQMAPTTLVPMSADHYNIGYVPFIFLSLSSLLYMCELETTLVSHHLLTDQTKIILKREAEWIVRCASPFVMPIAYIY
jgi:hypothetical protein